MKKCILLIVSIWSFSAQADVLPNPQITPGAIDPALTVQVICNPNWSTRTVRNVPDSVKRQVYNNYHVWPGQNYCAGPYGCEVDHLISLQLGGSNDIKNLWPQSYSGAWNARQKDQLENQLHRLVCAGRVSLAQAQHDIAVNWVEAYKKYMLIR